MKKIFFLIFLLFSCKEMKYSKQTDKLEKYDSTYVTDSSVSTINLDSINEMLDEMEKKVDRIKLINQDNQKKSDSIKIIKDKIKIKDKIIEEKEKQSLILMMKYHYNHLKSIDTLIVDSNHTD